MSIYMLLQENKTYLLTSQKKKLVEMLLFS